MPASATPRRPRIPTRLEVLRTERLTAHLQRVVLGGPGFEVFAEKWNGFTDSYVKLLFLPDGGTPERADGEPAPEGAVTRTYTVRWFDPRARELALDFVIHGDEGLAGPWARDARPGDTIDLMGPGGAYSPRADADWHLVAGDEAALPAALAALEALPEGARAHAFLEVDGPDEELKVETAGDVSVTWLHRRGAPAGSTTLVADAVKALDWPQGRAQVFVHGEAGLLKALRRFLLQERGVERDLLSLSGYWRRGDDEQGFRVWKRQQREEQSGDRATTEGSSATAS